MLKVVERHAKWLALLWLLVITILFFLPGSALPKHNWASKIYLDKWIHFGFFALLLFLWRFRFSVLSLHFWQLLFAAFSYGLAVEAIQHFFVSNRSFDLGDLVADVAGAISGLWFWWWRYIKK